MTVANELDGAGKTNFEVSYQGEKCKFTPEQLTASMLNKLKEIIYKNSVNFSSCNCVISVGMNPLSIVLLGACLLYGARAEGFAGRLQNCGNPGRTTNERNLGHRYQLWAFQEERVRSRSCKERGIHRLRTFEDFSIRGKFLPGKQWMI